MKYLTPLVFGLILFAAGARAGEDHDHVRRAMESGEILPLSVILERLGEEARGELIETELERHHGRPVYEIKLLTPDGRLRKLHVDAHDGSLLRKKERP